MLWDCQIVPLSVRESNFWECLWIQAMLCRSRPALSAAHTHTGVIPNPAKKKKAQNCAFSLFLFPFSSNLSSILISPTKFLLAFQMLISSFVIMDLKSTIFQFPLSASFPQLSRRHTDWFWCHLFLVFWTTFFGHLGMCRAKKLTYFEIVRVPHCVLLIPPHFPTRALSQAASQAGTEPEGQYTSSILHNGCHLLQSHWLHNIPRYP